MKSLAALISLFASVLLSSMAVADAAKSEIFEHFEHEVQGINYYSEKRGSGPYLVMVTSGQGDSGAYRFLAEELAERYKVMIFDLPGFSRSSNPLLLRKPIIRCVR
jgi:alpha-beta hydrolase superfamily lysophospholipase